MPSVSVWFAEHDFVMKTVPLAVSPDPDFCEHKMAMTPAAKQADGSESAALASACSSAENSAHRMP